MITYTIPELEPVLRLKARRIRTLLNNGELVGRFVGRQWLITDDALRSFLEQQDMVETKLKNIERRLQSLQE